MGNKHITTEKKFTSVKELMDYIAVHYITTADFTTLQHLSASCNSTVLITATSQMLNDHFNDVQLQNVIETNGTKRAVCVAIATYYARIAQLFSTVLLTIQTGPNGSFCSNRLGNLIEFYKPNITPCSKDDTMVELIPLYLDDGFENGTFTKMSEEATKRYKRDLHSFYKSFTGKTEVPETIQTFSDISFSVDATPIELEDTSVLEDYAIHIRKMFRRMSHHQTKLGDIIRKVFVVTNNEISIHPELTPAKLTKLTEECRKIILQMTLDCKNDYVEGLQIYEAVVESITLNTIQNQINVLQKEAEQIMSQ